MVSVRGNQTNNKVTASSSTSTNNKAEVKPISINNQVEATNNLAKYYSEISQNWAEGEGLIQNIDYSSKTYALQSKESATEAKASLDEAKGYTSDAVEEIQQLEQVVLSNISMLEQSASSTVEQGIQTIGETVSEALTTLETASDATIEEIKSVSDKIINRVSFELFDTKLSDHILTYEETKGWALQGTFVYKEAIAGERYGYPDFIAECIKQKNESEAIEVTLGENTIIMYQHTNGHKFYSISDKDAVDTWYNTYKIADFYGVDEENESVFLPRNDYFMQLTCDITKVNEMNEAGLPTLTTNSTGAHTHTRGTMNILGQFAVSGGGWFSGGHQAGAFTLGDSGLANCKSSGDHDSALVDFNASRNWTGETSSNGAHTHTIEGNADTVQPPSSNKLLYYCVGTTVADTSWIDIVAQVEAGVKDLDDKKNICIEEINATSTEIDTVKTNAVNEVKEEGQTQLNNIKSTGFYMRDDKLYFINSEGVEEEFKSGGGGGLEILDIGFSPFPIDETQNKRRILNGQVIIQEQFISATTKLKEAAELNPEMFCTEEEWQTAITMSVNGTCDKFVIDDVAGTIRLPKYPEYCNKEIHKDYAVTVTPKSQTATVTVINASTVGYLHSKGGSRWSGGHEISTTGGMMYQKNENSSNTGAYYNPNGTLGVTFTPSVTSNTTSNTKEEKQKGYWFIQLATGAEESVDVTREIELNNPYSLGDSKYSPVTLDNISWLKSEGQWNAKAVYPSFYDWALTNFNNGVEGFALSTGEYTDYDVVINSAEETFRLPLLNGEENLTSSKSNSKTITGNQQYTALANGWITVSGQSTANIAYIVITSSSESDSCWISASNNSVISSVKVTRGDIANIITYNVTSMTLKFTYAKGNGSLYYYVGETVQNANLINAGRVEEKITEALAKPHIVETYVNGTSWYRVYSDGWCEQGGLVNNVPDSVVTILFLKTYTSIPVITMTRKIDNGGAGNSTGAQIQTHSVYDVTNSSFRTYGNAWGISSVYWEAKGFIS